MNRYNFETFGVNFFNPSYSGITEYNFLNPGQTGNIYKTYTNRKQEIFIKHLQTGNIYKTRCIRIGY